ncbi:cellulose biosynthesis cyclic di-GMP-binding regulatory protein BcsB [Tepidanaerobacter acetatoxydans]|uniref:cellulose biosynthesis cyclic di-GMP-binding regulatory protein BcsB n=1 Tax=Tepidanaerobacter acetatoxydans TaxID=499229 RepID=UPI001BD2BF2D|nr:cellulose biosynthesis cyclic di-GMP-binding regulatory protein BcsB [Tepidanaerobacter acetatoxydans]
MKKITCIIIIFVVLLNSSAISAYAESKQNIYYVVQAGFYKNKAVLEENYNNLKTKGFPAYKFTVAGGTRLYVGNYKDIQTAKEVANKLQALGFETLIHTQESTTKPMVTSTGLPTDIISTAIEAPKITANTQNMVKNIPLSEDATIKGIFGSHSIFFFVDENWKVKDNCFFELVFSQSEIKKYKNSTLTVLLNDIPIKSIILNDKADYKAIEKLRLPKEQIIKGYNLIKFSTYHRITEESCTDDLNPANWITFHSESYIHMEYEEIPDKIGISDYPYPYLKVSASEPVNCIIAVPDKANNSQITAAMIIAADFGRRVPYNNVDVKVVHYSDIKNIDENTNFIVIGSSANADDQIFEPTRKELPDLKNRALIKEKASPNDTSKRILYLISDNDEMLLTAARSLTLDDLVLQMKTDTQFILKNNAENYESENQTDILTLKDLGYEDTILKGIFYQQAAYTIKLPRNHRLKEDSSIKIPLRYAGALDFDKSSVTVYLNNIPVTNKLLNKDRADKDEITVKIPKEFRDADSLELKLVFYLEPYDFDCKNWRYGDIWALISKDTSFNIPQEVIKDRFFQYYPDMFIKNGTFDDVVLVLPDKADQNYLTMAANITAFIGHSVSRVGNLSVIKGTELETSHNNIIVIGTPRDNAAIKNLNDKLYIKFDENFEKFEPSDKIYLLENYSRGLSSLQLLASPFNGKKHLMVVTAAEEKNLMPAQIYLKDLAFNVKLSGDGLIIDSEGDIYSAYFVKPKQAAQDESSKTSPKYETRLRDNPQFIIYLIFFLMIIIISVYGLIIITRSKE